MKILQTELETVTPEKAQQYLDLVDFGQRSLDVARPRHENSGAVPKVNEGRSKNAAGSHFRNKKSA